MLVEHQKSEDYVARGDGFFQGKYTSSGTFMQETTMAHIILLVYVLLPQ